MSVFQSLRPERSWHLNAEYKQVFLSVLNKFLKALNRVLHGHSGIWRVSDKRIVTRMTDATDILL